MFSVKLRALLASAPSDGGLFELSVSQAPLMIAASEALEAMTPRGGDAEGFGHLGDASEPAHVESPQAYSQLVARRCPTKPVCLTRASGDPG